MGGFNDIALQNGKLQRVSNKNGGDEIANLK